MPDNTPIATAEDVRVLARLYYGYDGHVAGVDPYDEPKLAKHLALADAIEARDTAIEALTKAQNGCGLALSSQVLCGRRTKDGKPFLCSRCHDARERAIRTLTEVPENADDDVNCDAHGCFRRLVPEGADVTGRITSECRKCSAMFYADLHIDAP